MLYFLDKRKKLISRLDVLILINSISAPSSFMIKDMGCYRSLILGVIYIILCRRCYCVDSKINNFKLFLRFFNAASYIQQINTQSKYESFHNLKCFRFLYGIFRNLILFSRLCKEETLKSSVGVYNELNRAS